MRSRLCTGVVKHERSRPVGNRFRYRVYYVHVDLAELDELDGRLRLFSHNRPNLVSFHDSDHGPRDGSPLRPWIDGLLARAGVDLDGGRVTLLTFPRVLGMRFCPVSFWYCYGSDGLVRAVLAEVQNTFRDHHNYLLHEGGAPLDWGKRPRKAKAFYISPFIQLEDVVHEFVLAEPGPDGVRAGVRELVEGEPLLETHLSLEPRDLTDAGLIRAVARYGAISARALVLIHWQALKLVAKRVPYYPHTPPPKEETS